MKRTLILALAIGLAACGSEAPEETAETMTEEPAVEASEMPAADAPLLNPNTASEEELAALPLISEGLASGLVAARPFASMADLHAALSATLSEEQCAELYTQLFIPINLNTATREEMLLIPGVGERMAGEFEEYRPYEAMAQFRREIGKYVDDAEVARLERYVTLD